MKITIINGSPKAMKSRTLEFARIIKEKFKENNYTEIPVGAKIRSLENNSSKLKAVFEEMKNSDVIIWSFPVYVLVVPYQLMRFIEMIQTYGEKDMLKGKYATSISTSFNFFDQTAHTYMREVSEDLGLRYFEGFSPSAASLDEKKLQQNLLSLAEELFFLAKNNLPTENTCVPFSSSTFIYRPKNIEKNSKTGEKRILVLSDADDTAINLKRMTDVYEQSVSHAVDVVNLHDIDIRGGCLGCGKCMATAVCVYKDDFASLYKEKVLPSDVIIYTASIRSRYISSTWKKYFDRNFVNGHRPILSGKPMGFLFSGPLRRVPNLRDIFNAHVQVGRNPLIGFQTDECADDEELSAQIRAFAGKTDRMAINPWERPPTFLGVGGHKIFRDLIYSMRTVMVEDHKYYTEQGFYDFPK